MVNSQQQESDMGSPLNVTDSSFKSDVLDSDLPVLVDFWASWCSPCKMIAPIVEDLASEYEGRVRIAKIDIDANPVVPGQFGVLSIPTLMLFHGGKPAERIVGYQPKAALKAKIEQVLTSV
jgi:thioredoxin 1